MGVSSAGKCIDKYENVSVDPIFIKEAASDYNKIDDIFNVRRTLTLLDVIPITGVEASYINSVPKEETMRMSSTGSNGGVLDPSSQFSNDESGQNFIEEILRTSQLDLDDKETYSFNIKDLGNESLIELAELNSSVSCFESINDSDFGCFDLTSNCINDVSNLESSLSNLPDEPSSGVLDNISSLLQDFTKLYEENKQYSCETGHTELNGGLHTIDTEVEQLIDDRNRPLDKTDGTMSLLSPEFNQNVPSQFQTNSKTNLKLPVLVLQPLLTALAQIRLAKKTKSQYLEEVVKTGKKERTGVSQQNIDSVCEKSMDRQEGTNNANSLNKQPKTVATISISTDKKSNTTQIAIKTAQGETKFRIKTSDLLRETGSVDGEPIKLQDLGLHLKAIRVSKERNRGSKFEQSDNEVSNTTSISTENNFPTSDPNPSNPNNFNVIKEDITEIDQFKPEEKTNCLSELKNYGVDCNFVTMKTKSGQKLYMCPIVGCGRAYPNIFPLKIHVLQHKNIKPYKCDEEGCQWAFYTFGKLKRHKESHKKMKPYACEFMGCGKRFVNHYNLQAHQKTHKRVPSIPCPQEGCNQVFELNRQLKAHLKNDHVANSFAFKCPNEDCGKGFLDEDTLKSHVKNCSRSNEDERTCSYCGRVYSLKSKLKVHLMIHTNERPYKCPVPGCCWAFHTRPKLKRHLKLHSDSRDYVCPHVGCDKAFRRKEHLRNHVLTHNPQQVFECFLTGCNCKFADAKDLQSHLQWHLKKPEVYRCLAENCNDRFQSKEDLQQHIFQVHFFAMVQKAEGTSIVQNDDSLLSMDANNSSHSSIDPSQASPEPGGKDWESKNISITSTPDNQVSIIFFNDPPGNQKLIGGSQKNRKRKPSVKSGSINCDAKKVIETIPEMSSRSVQDNNYSNAFIDPSDVLSFTNDLLNIEGLPTGLLSDTSQDMAQFTGTTINLKDLE